MSAGDRESSISRGVHDDVARVLAGGGEAGALARSVDWSATAIGPVERWSPALRAAAALVLHNDFPMLLWCDDIALLIDRKVHREESHFRLAYSPVPDETVQPIGVGGVLATVTEITQQVYAERQLRTLRELGADGATEGRSAEEACAATAAKLRQNPQDVPFALFFLLDESGRRARLVANAGFGLLPSDYPGAQELVIGVDAGERDGVERWNIDQALLRGQAIDFVFRAGTPRRQAYPGRRRQRGRG